MRRCLVALPPVPEYVAHYAMEESMRRTPAPGPRGVLEVDWRLGESGRLACGCPGYSGDSRGWPRPASYPAWSSPD